MSDIKRVDKVVIHDSESRALQTLEPIEEGKISIYCCGLTVYNYAHIGNLRTYFFEDTLIRMLRQAGYEVRHVMNITDVGHLSDDGDYGEDKMIREARSRGMSVWDIARFFTDTFFTDCEKLNIIKPDIVCKATEHIDDMIGLIKRLEDRGFTYQTGGNIYFDTQKLPDYGRLARLDHQELKAGARVDQDSNKRHQQDFVLWFTAGKFTDQAMEWDSPWGRGYPGWHIECSAMSSRYLGEHFDIHCGGIDHIPVHHTNEIAQSEAAFGHRWVNYWMHGEYLIFNKGKMAKSGEAFLTLQSLSDAGYEPLDYRYYLLGAHYRSQLNFNYIGLQGARRARTKLREKLKRLTDTKAAEKIGSDAGKYLDRFYSAIRNDLNTPQALAILWELSRNETLPPAETVYLIDKMDEIFALDLLSQIENSVDESEKREIEELMEVRNEARQKRDFATADEIRDKLKSMGVKIKDDATGTTWEKM